MSRSKILVFGSNDCGQAGVANGEDILSLPLENLHSYIDSSTISRVITCQKQTYMILTDGSVLSCGDNDKKELARAGKRSLFQRIDSLEAYSIIDIACGDGFFIFITKDGKIICWGANDLGQLSCGDREYREKPKLNSNISEGILQVVAGSHHVLALTNAGNVVSWGGNRKGQLGDGQMTSSTSPLIVTPLRHRPVISIACGESHSMALTIGGSVYVWGDNAQGQLGLGDTTPRLRAELVRSLRAAKASKISAGRQHSMVISKSGLLFGFGSNSFGQLGIGESDVRILTTPTVVDKLREMRAIDVCCGSGHTLVLCATESFTRVYAMGLNSSGQLGLGHTHNVSTPAMIPISSDKQSVGVGSGPLSMTSFIYLDGISLSRKSLPALGYSILAHHVHRLTNATNPTNELRLFRESIASAFSSISVLNASFRIDHHHAHASASSSHVDANSLCVDMDSVRRSYALLCEIGNEQIMWTLGRASIQLSERLKECPWDDTENLSVFLIVLENPLMLQSKSFYIMVEHVISGILALPKSCRAILFNWLRSYSSEYFCRVIIVLQTYLSHAFTNRALSIDPAPTVLVLDSLYKCNAESHIIPAVAFYHPNLHQAVNLIDEWNKYKLMEKQSKVFNYFSYPFIIDYEVKNAIMRVDFLSRQSQQSNVFLQRYFYHQQHTSLEHLNSSPRIPRGLIFYMKSGTSSHDISSKPECCFEMRVNRASLLDDVLRLLRHAIADDINILALPLRAVFIGEEGVDQGGVKKELLTLAIRELIQRTHIILPCGTNQSKVWFHPPIDHIHEMDVQVHASVGDPREDIVDADSSAPRKIPRLQSHTDSSSNIHHVSHMHDHIDLCYQLGLLMGLAAYNDVLIDLPLPSSIYKIMAGMVNHIGLEDLYEADITLARGMKMLLDYEDGPISEVFGVTFTASSNPLLDNAMDMVGFDRQPSLSSTPSADTTSPSTSPSYQPATTSSSPFISSKNVHFIELLHHGNDVPVDRSNRQEFVQLFTQWTLYGSAKASIDSYLSGIKVLFKDPIISLCTHSEIEILLSGSKDIGDLSDLRVHTKYTGEYNDEHCIIQWFWDILSNMSKYDQRKFLHFVTGSDRVPVGGISKLGLMIQSSGQPATALPTSHTCFNVMNIPSSYISAAQLQDRIRLALEHSEGFGFA